MFFDVVLYEPVPVQVNVVWKSLSDTFSMVRTSEDVVPLFFMTLAKKEKKKPTVTAHEHTDSHPPP